MNPGLITTQSTPEPSKTQTRRRSLYSRAKRCLHPRGNSGVRGNSAFTARSTKVQYPQPPQQEEISIPGVNKIFDKDYTAFGKIFWVIAITFCFISCTILTVNRILKYLETPIAIRVEVRRESSLTFPAITICPFYPFFYSEKIDALRDNYSVLFNVSYTRLDYFMDNTTIRHLDLLRLPDVAAAELWDSARVGDYEYIITCQFESRRNCDRKVHFRDVYTHFGVCITASFDDKVIYDGSYNGVEIKLTNHSNREKAYWQHTVLLHDADDEPTHILYREGGQPIHPKRETTVTFLTKQFERVNVSRRPCQDKKQVTQCVSDCIANHISKVAECTLPFFNNTSMKECTTPQSAARTYDSTLKIYKQSETLCSLCPLKCVEYYYSPLYDSVYYRNFTSAKVILVDNSMDLVQEYASYSFDSLLADVGGNLGLFLGVCTLTLFQLLEALVMKVKTAIKCGSEKLHKSPLSKSTLRKPSKFYFSNN